MGTLLGPEVVGGCGGADDFASDATCNRRGATVVVEAAVGVLVGLVDTNRDVVG
jgi:hypothetical protein